MFGHAHAMIPLPSSAAMDTTQLVLHSGGRWLLMLAMTLFLAYVLFLIGTVVLASAANTVRSLRRAPHLGRHASQTVGHSAEH